MTHSQQTSTIVTVVAMMSLVTFALWWSIGKPSQPCRFQKPVHHLGRVRTDDTFDHAFRFSNVAATPLEIVRVTGSCGCLAHSLQKHVYPAGDSGAIGVTLDTSGMAAPSNLSKQLIVEYVCNGTRNLVHLKLQAKLFPDVSVAPTRPALSWNDEEEVYQGEVSVRRELLSVAEFDSLCILAADPYQIVCKTSLNRDERTFQVTSHAGISTGRPLEVQLGYVRDGKQRRYQVPLQLTGHGSQVALTPTSYLAVIPAGSKSEEVERISTSTFTLKESGERNQIVSARAVPAATSEYLSWERTGDGNNGLKVWVAETPVEIGLWESSLEVVVGTKTGQRTLVLPCYVSVEPSGAGTAQRFSQEQSSGEETEAATSNGNRRDQA